ncbi:hypothetical protein ABID52_000975 [Fictibacillus halophilus]|uniref:Uncharacterized protein n=1 Tax=Fictibacillus halophilus TaxID=1610490 RepID=A0ABV2LFM1_9BACL
MGQAGSSKSEVARSAKGEWIRRRILFITSHLTFDLVTATNVAHRLHRGKRTSGTEIHYFQRAIKYTKTAFKNEIKKIS